MKNRFAAGGAVVLDRLDGIGLWLGMLGLRLLVVRP